MEILTDLIIILSVSAVVLFISTKLKLPSIVGFLTAGILVGPYGIELITTTEDVDVMAEIGILLLLFSIGIEFSLGKLIEAKKYVLIGGGAQVGLSILLFFVGAYLFGLTTNQALFVGMLFAMSSTAIVLQIFQEKGWMNTLFGKSSVSILIFQDIIIIPMMLAVPYLTVNGNASSESFEKILLGVLLIILVVFAARKIVPPLIRSIIHTRNQELFLITIIVICFATAFVTKQLGLKLALGAFLAGLIISESEYSFEALKN
ncbi:MAG: cation:proton antiporter, partial [Bacteroidota bacterium]